MAPFSRVLWRDQINPRIVEVMWIKNKHGIHHDYMVL